MIDPARRRPLAVGGAIVLLGLATRAAVMAPLLHSAPSDPDDYLVLAASLAEGDGLRVLGRPTAYRPPLYPIALAPGVALLGPTPTAWVAALHLACGGLAIALTGLAARRWGLPGRSATLAMVIVAFDPVLIAQSRGVTTEPMAAALVAALLAACVPTPTIVSSALIGAVGGLASLCRPSLLPAVGLIAAALAVGSPARWPARAARSGAMLAALVATLAPWAARNAVALGSPIWTTTHGGYTLLLANNPAYYDDVLDGPMAVWSGPNQDRWFAEVNRLAEGRPEPESDRLYRRMALRVMVARPTDAWRATRARLCRFWALAPSEAVYSGPLRLLTASWTAPLWILLAVGLARRSAWGWPRVAAPAVLLALTLVHAAYWTDLRMRAPVVPAIALAAAGAIAMPVRPRQRHTGRLGS